MGLFFPTESTDGGGSTSSSTSSVSTPGSSSGGGGNIVRPSDSGSIFTPEKNIVRPSPGSAQNSLDRRSPAPNGPPPVAPKSTTPHSHHSNVTQHHGNTSKLQNMRYCEHVIFILSVELVKSNFVYSK